MADSTTGIEVFFRASAAVSSTRELFRLPAEAAGKTEDFDADDLVVGADVYDQPNYGDDEPNYGDGPTTGTESVFRPCH
jgi:hypothetical protein